MESVHLFYNSNRIRQSISDDILGILSFRCGNILWEGGAIKKMFLWKVFGTKGNIYDANCIFLSSDEEDFKVKFVFSLSQIELYIITSLTAISDSKKYQKNIGFAIYINYTPIMFSVTIARFIDNIVFVVSTVKSWDFY